MNHFKTPQPQPIFPYYQPSPPEDLPNVSNMNPMPSVGTKFPQNEDNPYCAQLPFTVPPYLRNNHPNSAPQRASNPSQAPDRPYDPNLVPRELYEAVLAENRDYFNQVKHLKKTNNKLHRQISKAKADLLKANKRNGWLESQGKQGKAHASTHQEESYIEKIIWNSQNGSKIDMRSKIKELEQEVTNLKSKLRAEETGKKELSYKVSTLQETVKRFRKSLECQQSGHKEALKSQQEDFNRKLEDCSEAIDNEIKQYKELLTKMNKLSKKNIEIQQQLNKITTENTKLLSELKAEKEKVNEIVKEKETIPSEIKTGKETAHECECAQEAQDLWKLVRQLQQSNRSQIQPTSTVKIENIKF